MIRIRDTIQSIVRDEVTNILRELLNAQKNEINTLISQHLKQHQQQPQQQSIPPKVQPTANRIITPVPTVASSSVISITSTIDTKQQMALKLVQSGQINQAFEYVLSAADLNLVLYLCENIRASELFSMQPCPLQIPVILSLIQQLAADLSTYQELKYR